jgi:hypothetical protein
MGRSSDRLVGEQQIVAPSAVYRLSSARNLSNFRAYFRRIASTSHRVGFVIRASSKALENRDELSQSYWFVEIMRRKLPLLLDRQLVDDVSVVETPRQASVSRHPRSHAEIPFRKVVTSASSRWPSAPSQSAISTTVEGPESPIHHPRARWRPIATSPKRWRS